MYNLEEAPGRTARVAGKEYLFFSGYNYLGMNFVPDFLSLLQQGVEKYGWIFPSSRVSNTQLEIYQECEALLSEITGSEDTVLFPSGFAAGRAALLSAGAPILNAPHAHPAIRADKSSISSFDEWQKTFPGDIGNNGYRGFASDSVNPLMPAVYDFSFLTRVQKAMVAIIDDSHGIGLTGAGGRGAAVRVPPSPNIEYVFCYSLSKAFGISAGAVSCTAERADILRKLPEYAAVTPPLPAQLHAFIKGQELYQEQRQRLLENVSFFASCIKDIKGISYESEFPVFVLPGSYDENKLSEAGIIISSFAYPDPEGETLKRIVVNALHTKQDLEYTAACLYKYNVC